MWPGRKSATARKIESLTGSLEKVNLLPKNCDISKLGPLTMAALYDEGPADEIISDTVFCGMDRDPDLAILKALVECSERFAFQEGVNRGDSSCATERSDGVAAFPIIPGCEEQAHLLARKHALAEALERFVWATWWDNHDLGFSAGDLRSAAYGQVAALMNSIEELVEISKWWLIQPFLPARGQEVVIIFAELSSGGVISGGAAGELGDENVYLRALGELARHAVAAGRIMNGGSPKSFYEQRLAFMLSPEGGVRLHQRLKIRGERVLEIPQLQFDEAIDHKLRDAVAVHRCLFVNQPPFVGGELERLCL